MRSTAALGTVPTTLFAERVGLLGTEEAFKLAALIREVEAGGEPVIRANLGQPDFPLPAHVARAVRRALEEGRTTYCDAQGLLELRKAVAAQVGGRTGRDIDPDRVVVYPGARAPIGFAQQTYCETGDEVVYPTPGYPLFESFVTYVGAVPVPLVLDPRRGFVFDGDDLAPLLGPRTRLVFLNFPSNPTGGVASREQLASIARAVLERGRPDLRVYSDESYEAIVFDGRTHRSILSVPGMEDRTIVVSGVSKTYSWTGGRIGWAVYPTVEEALVHRNLNINYFASLPPYNQVGARVALESPASAEAVRRMVEAFQARRDAVVARLNDVPGVSCGVPDGAFYVFPDVSGLLEEVGALDEFGRLPAGVRERTSPATLFTLFLLHRWKVAVMDRRSFGVLGSEDQHFLRISVATGLPDLELAVDRLAAAGRDPDGFRAFVRGGGPLAL